MSLDLLHAALVRNDGSNVARQLITRTNDPRLINQYRKWLTLVDFDYPLNRTYRRPAPSPIAIDDVELVWFHADTQVVQRSSQECQHALLKSFETAARVMPRAKRILLTDVCTAWDTNLPAEIHRFNVDLKSLMFERLRLQAAHIEQRNKHTATIFLDSDVILLRDLTPVFSSSFDVALTWRKNPVAPFNNGVFFVAADSVDSAASLRFLQRGLDCYQRLAEDKQVQAYYGDIYSWGGDQYAFAVVVGQREFVRRPTDDMLIDCVHVKLLPCELYNFTPKKALSYEALADKYCLHFKGPHKDLRLVS